MHPYLWRKLADDCGIPGLDGMGHCVLGERMLFAGGYAPIGGQQVTFKGAYLSDGVTCWQVSDDAFATSRHSFPLVFHPRTGRAYSLGGDRILGIVQPEVYSTETGEGRWRLDDPAAPWGEFVLGVGCSDGDYLYFLCGQKIPATGVPVDFNYALWRSPEGLAGTWVKIADHLPLGARGAICGMGWSDGELIIVGGGTYDTWNYPRRFKDDVIGLRFVNGEPVLRMIAGRMPGTPTLYHSVVDYDDHIFRMFGHDGTRDLREIWRSDELHDHDWTRDPDAPCAARHAANVLNFKSAVHVIAGSNYQPDWWTMYAKDKDGVHYGTPPDSVTAFWNQTYTLIDGSIELPVGATVRSIGTCMRYPHADLVPKIFRRQGGNTFDVAWSGPPQVHSGQNQYHDLDAAPADYTIPSPGHFIGYSGALGSALSESFCNIGHRWHRLGDAIGNGLAFTPMGDGTIPMRWTEAS